MGLFNPEAFMSASISEAMDTRLQPCPVGEWGATISKVDVRGGESEKTESGIWAAYNVTWDINDPEAKRLAGREKLSSRQTVFLDLTADGTIDMAKGRNIRLGKLRDAIGQNQPGMAWNPMMMVGHSAVVKVDHRPDQNDSSIMYDEVTAVRPA